MNRGIRLGRIDGIEIIADVSILVIAGILTWVMYVDVGVSQPGTDPAIASLIAILAGVLFIGSVFIHEGSHAVVATRRGLLVRSIRLLAFGGYTVIEGTTERPSDEFAIAVAGPIASFVLTGLFWLAGAVMGAAPAVQSALQFLAVTNLFIAMFNLLPGFPLDGGRALRAVIWRVQGNKARATAAAVRAGRILGWAVIIAGTAYALVRLEPLAFLLILLGWYLLRSAQGAGRREQLLVGVDGLTAGDVMSKTPDPVPGNMTVNRMVELFQIGARLRSLPVEVDGRIRGVIGEQEIADLSPVRRVTLTASAAMTGIGPGDVIAVDTPLDAMMNRPPGKTGRLVVVENGRAVGIIEGRDLGAAVGDVA